ncbi:hypothetical protein IFR05_006663 [Cadophora sp. M221]|nr:hypothetical protein IFR05_006663 [Cadophora sp. M221]
MSSRRMYEPDWARYKDRIIAMANKRYPLSKISRYLYKKKRFFPSYRQLETAVKRWEADGLIQNYESDASAEDFRDSSNRSQVPTAPEPQGASRNQAGQDSAADGITGVDERFRDNGLQATPTSAGDGIMDVDRPFYENEPWLTFMSSEFYTATTTAPCTHSQPLRNEVDVSTNVPQSQNKTIEVPLPGLGITPDAPVDGQFEQGFGDSCFHSDERWNDTYDLNHWSNYGLGEEGALSGS